MFQVQRLSADRMAVVDLLDRSLRFHRAVHGVFEWDVTETLARLERDRAAGRDVGLAAYVVKATALTLARHPRLNRRVFRRWLRLCEVSWDEVSCNLVVAREVAPGEEVLIPLVLRHADRRPIEELHAEIRRAKQAPLEQLPQLEALRKLRRLPRPALWLINYLIKTSPGFVIQRFGTYGVSMLAYESVGLVSFTPITASTTFFPMTIHERPTVRDGAVAVRTMLVMGMSLDHTLVDALDGARAIKTLRDLVERPEAILGPDAPPGAAPSSPAD